MIWQRLIVSKIIDLTGKTFGRLHVIEKAPSTGGQAEWICQCDCGKVKKVRTQHLRSGAIQSCGCYMIERISESTTVDLTGQRFGRLRVMRYDGSQSGRAKWHCLCDCGKEVSVFSSYLRTGDTQSCGCLISRQEEIIENILKTKGVPFKRQYTFQDLRGKKYPLRFDFALLNDDEYLKCLIEYQGAAHFYNVFKVSEQEYESALRRDRMKIDYCKDHNIKLFELSKSDNIAARLEEIISICASKQLSMKIS